MKRLLMFVSLSAAAGGLIAMSSAQALAFTPTPSATAAVPAAQLGASAPVAGDLQQAVSTQRSFAMKLHDWLATYFDGPIYAVTGGAGYLAPAGDEILDLAGAVSAGSPQPECPFQLPAFKYPAERWIFLAKRTGSQAYGSPAIGVPGRVTSREEILDVAREAGAR